MYVADTYCVFRSYILCILQIHTMYLANIYCVYCKYILYI